MEKVFKNGPSKICGRQPLKNFTWFIFEYFAAKILGFKKLLYVIKKMFKQYC